MPNNIIIPAAAFITKSVLISYLCITNRNSKTMSLLNSMLVYHSGWLGPWEITAIVVVVLLLFGGRKIPELMKGLGKGMKEFKEGIGGDEDKKEKNDTDAPKDNTK